MLKRIEKLLEDKNNKEVIEKFISKLENKEKYKLPEVLQIKLDGIKNNPIDETEIALKKDSIDKQIESGDLDPQEAFFEIIESVYTVSEIETLQQVHKIKIKDIISFSSMLSNKVFSQREEDKDGELQLKEIESQNELEPITYGTQKLLRKELKKFYTLNKKASDLSSEIIELTKEDKKTKDKNKELNKLTDQLEVGLKQLEENTYKYSKLDVSEMSEWEKKLLYAKVTSMAYGNYTPPVGKN